jgi:hypothetical protein
MEGYQSSGYKEAGFKGSWREWNLKREEREKRKERKRERERGCAIELSAE